MKLEKLFSPVKIGKKRIKNRIVMAPMGANFEDVDGSVSESLIDYFEARARGGVGLIIEFCVPLAGGEGIFPSFLPPRSITWMCRLSRWWVFQLR